MLESLQYHSTVEDSGMTKWEYCRINWTVGKVSDEDLQRAEQEGLPTRIMAETADGTKYATGGYLFVFSSGERRILTDIQETIRDLGLEGWELASDTITGGRDLLELEVLYFKRPLPE
jgi:hypothetical protein